MCFDVATTERPVLDADAGDKNGDDETSEVAAFCSIAEMRAVRILRHAA